MSGTWEEKVAGIGASIRQMRDDPNPEGWTWFLNNAEQWLASALSYPPETFDMKRVIQERDAALEALDEIYGVVRNVRGRDADD